jgi:phosphate-selective porin OprO/OprP
MILHQLTAFALLSSSHLLGQAVVKTPEQPEAAEKPNASATPTGTSEADVAPGSQATATESPAPEATAPMSDSAGSEEATMASTTEGAADAPSEPALVPKTTPAPVEDAPGLEKVPPKEASDEVKSESPTVKAKFGQGVSFATPDEMFSLRLRARMQLRAAYTNPDGPENDLTHALIRRARLLLEGNAYGPELTYDIQLGFSNRDTESDLRLPLRDARLTYTALRDLSIQAGQMKVPYGRQRVTSTSAQQMVDRSIVVGELNLDRDVGAYFFSKDLFGLSEVLGYSLGVFGGDGRNRVSDHAGLMYVGRLSVTPFGSFDEFVESDISRDPKPRLAVAVGGAYNQNTNRTRSTFESPFADEDVTFDYTHLGADFMFKWHGFFATGEWMYRVADVNFVEGVDDSGAPTNYYAREAWGAYGQIGQMLTDKLELSARYGHLEPLSETEPTLLKQEEMGGSVGYYFSAHNLKIQTDYFYYVFEDDFATGTHEARSQLQLFF